MKNSPSGQSEKTFTSPFSLYSFGIFEILLTPKVLLSFDSVVSSFMRGRITRNKILIARYQENIADRPSRRAVPCPSLRTREEKSPSSKGENEFIQARDGNVVRFLLCHVGRKRKIEITKKVKDET